MTAVIRCVCLALVACSNSPGLPFEREAAAAVGCPDEVGEPEAWTAVGDDAQCDELAAELSSDPECVDTSEFKLVESDDGECMGSFMSFCDGRNVYLACTVQPSGAAECVAIVTSDDLVQGMCEFAVTLEAVD